VDHGALGELARRQHGVVSLAQVRGVGGSRNKAWYLVGTGAWRQLHDGVFAIVGAPATRAQTLIAACLAIGPEAAISHRAAAQFHGLLTFRDCPVEVTTDRRRSPEVDGAIIHRMDDFSAHWVCEVDGLRVTTVARTLVDLGAVCRPSTVEAALDRALGRRLVTIRSVRDALVAVARQGRRGVGVLRPFLDERLGVAAPAGVMEARMASLLRRAGIVGAIPEYVVKDRRGSFVAVVDFAFPDARLAVEVDGYEAHAPLRAFEDGKVRDRLLLDADWRPLHFFWSEVDRQHPRVAADVRRHLRRLPP